MIMVLHVNEIPVEWAKQLELCVCHRELFNELNGYQIRCVLNAHYGSWVHACPMSGKVIPEMVAGGMEQTFELLKARSEETFRSYIPLKGTQPPTAEDWEITITDLKQGSRSHDSRSSCWPPRWEIRRIRSSVLYAP